MDEQDILQDKPVEKTEADNEPQVFAVSKDEEKFRFTRREFLELAAATSVAATA